MGIGLLLVLVMAPFLYSLYHNTIYILKCQPLNVNTSCDESSPISKAQVVDGLYYGEMA